MVSKSPENFADVISMVPMHAVGRESSASYVGRLGERGRLVRDRDQSEVERLPSEEYHNDSL